MYLDSLLTLALLATPSLGLLRFPCSQLTTERMDPLVFPGVISPHVHQIIGGNAFNISMDPNLDYGRTATCTTCRFQQDKSNYWTAILYFKHPNGTYIRVPQKANHAVGSPNGGMTVYYIQPNDGSRVTAFAPGFRMISGDPLLRTRPARSANRPATYASTFRCWQGTDLFDPSNQGAPGSGATDTVELPNKPCAAGIRTNLYFPSCWDGVNLDSPDHSSHVAYFEGNVGAGGLFLSSGRCPSTHPVKIPMILYEIAWDTTPFNSMWPTDGSQPFVFSMGDPTGYGQHGDYVFGWEGDSLQRAMDTCTDISGVPESCGPLTVIQDNQINQCRQNSRVPEDIMNVNSLPGCNPIQRGPDYATYPASCDAVSTTIDGANPSLPPVYVTGAPNPNPSPNPSPTPAPSPTPTPAPGPTIPKWGQCGGQGWTGGTTCAPGSTCTFVNQWYSQCL